MLFWLALFLYVGITLWRLPDLYIDGLSWQEKVFETVLFVVWPLLWLLVIPLFIGLMLLNIWRKLTRSHHQNWI